MVNVDNLVKGAGDVLVTGLVVGIAVKTIRNIPKIDSKIKIPKTNPLKFKNYNYKLKGGFK